MSVNISETAFTTEYPIDKIFAQGTETFTVPPVSSINSVFFHSIPNPHGKKGLTTCSWSIDGINFYDQTSSIFYEPDPIDYILGFSVNVGCSDSSIFFSAINGFLISAGYVSPQNVTVNWTVANVL